VPELSDPPLAPPLAPLVARAKQGDRAAFERLVQATARLVYAHVVAIVRDRQKAEDLAQETYLAAWKNISAVESPNGFVAWLLTLARNNGLDSLKFDNRLKRRAPANGNSVSPAADNCPDDAPAPPQVLEHAEARDRALQLLEELPEEYRRPLAMRYLASADYDTIRRALNLSDGALRGLLSRGMALLRERMTRGDVAR